MLVRYLTIFSMAVACFPAVALTNVVHREICYENGDVLVRDRIELVTGGWASQSNLNTILVEHRKGGTQLTESVKTLYAGEDTSLVNCTARLEDSVLRLDVMSKVKTNFTRPSRLRCLPTYVGYRIKFHNAGKESEPYFLVHAGNGIHLLSVPAWDAPTNLAYAVAGMANIWGFSDQFPRRHNTPTLHFLCVLKSGTNTHVLFEGLRIFFRKPFPTRTI